MSLYRPNGRGHRALQLLAHGDHHFEALAFMGGARTRSAKKKLYTLLQATVRHAFVERRFGAYALTPLGAAAIAQLDAGEAVEILDEPAPNARIFTRRAA